MDKKDYFVVEAKVKSVNGTVIHEASSNRSSLELELGDNEFGINAVDVAGMLPIETGDVVRVGFKKSVYVGHFHGEGHTYKTRTQDDLKPHHERADVVEKLRNGKVVATYLNFWH
ncbi:hypothetical protein HY484_00225 [Candidatus Woesearchaeota archaeon]|nr:hypothetical protein [Candidatus Woesearchaeota archaeon]